MAENEKSCLNKRLLESEEDLCSMGPDSQYRGQQRHCFISQWISPLSLIVGQTFYVHTNFRKLWLSLRAVTLFNNGPPTSATVARTEIRKILTNKMWAFGKTWWELYRMTQKNGNFWKTQQKLKKSKKKNYWQKLNHYNLPFKKQ